MHRVRHHPNNVGAESSEICPVTANKLASASSTGMQASDGGSQLQGEGAMPAYLIF